MPKPAKEDIFNLPNYITLVRLGSIPVILTIMCFNGRFWSWIAVSLFCVAGATDLLDGFLARRLKKVTVLGTYLDPMADKLLVCSILIFMVSLNRAPVWAAIIIVCREIAVTGMRAVAASRGFDVPSDWFGKSKTALQMLAILLLLIHYNLGGFDSHFWGEVVLWLAVGVSVLSGTGYFLRFVRRLSSPE